MDDEKIHRDTQGESEAPEIVRPASVQSPTAEVFAPPSGSGDEAWRSGSGCGPRARIYLMAVAAMGLVAILLVGLSVLRRGVWVTLDQGRQAVVQNLPFDLPPAEKQRTMKNLDRFRRLLEASDDPYPAMGEFMTRVRAVLEDGRLTVDEVGGLNVYIERVIEESGIPPLQLGFRISNFEFRIAAHTSDASIPGPAPCPNSKFKIQNSKFS